MLQQLFPMKRGVRTILRSLVCEMDARFRQGLTQRHSLSGELIVSLTSYPPRFRTLKLSLLCLLKQSVRPDRIVLWIASADRGRLPRLPRQVEVRECDDIGPYKKLIPALEAFPDAFIVTADDDLYYPPDWLERLVSAYDGSSIIARRADRVLPDFTVDWCNLISCDYGPSDDVLASSGTGILFPPGSLHPDVTDRQQFLSLCPTADDIWYYWMARGAGTKTRKIGDAGDFVCWNLSQGASLWSHNETAHNGIMEATRARFGSWVSA